MFKIFFKNHKKIIFNSNFFPILILKLTKFLFNFPTKLGTKLPSADHIQCTALWFGSSHRPMPMGPEWENMPNSEWISLRWPPPQSSQKSWHLEKWQRNSPARSEHCRRGANFFNLFIFYVNLLNFTYFLILHLFFI